MHSAALRVQDSTLAVLVPFAARLGCECLVLCAIPITIVGPVRSQSEWECWVLCAITITITLLSLLQVWVSASLDEQGRVVLQGDSDSQITRGLCAILVQAMAGMLPADLLQVAAHAQKRCPLDLCATVVVSTPALLCDSSGQPGKRSIS